MTRALDVLEDYLDWKGLEYVRLDGNTASADRGAIVQSFNATGSSISVFLLSIRAGGVGLNLQSADTVIMYDTGECAGTMAVHAACCEVPAHYTILIHRCWSLQAVDEMAEGLKSGSLTKLCC